MRIRAGTMRRRLSRSCAILALCGALAAGCTVGPSRRPDLATSGGMQPSTTTPPASAGTMPTGPGGPGRQAPPIAWGNCPEPAPERGTPSTGSSAQSSAATTPPATTPSTPSSPLPDTPPSTTGGAPERPATFTTSCAEVTVPVSYDAPTHATIPIRVSRALAQGTPSDAPPLLVLADGPPAGGSDYVIDVARTLPTAITDHYAVITIDPRGTGHSGGIDCISNGNLAAILGLDADSDSNSTSNSGTNTDAVTAISRQLAFDCGDLVDESLTNYDSTDAADDLDTVRAALGVPAIDIIGTGFGGTLAATYADRYPGRVRHAVIDSPSDPSQATAVRATETARAAESLLTDFVAACPQLPGGCPLGDEPLAAITSLVGATHGDADSPVDWTVTGGSILRTLLDVLPQRAAWPDLATALAAVRDGDTGPLATLLTGTLGAGHITETLSAGLIYRCNDDATRLTGNTLATAIADARKEAPIFGAYTVTLAALCGDWPAPDHALGSLTAHGAPPLLVIGAVKGVRHPYSGVQALAARLESATLVSWQSGADAAYPANSCVTHAVDRYLLKGTVPTSGLLCPP